MPLVIADGGDIEIYKPKEVIDLSVHVSNVTGNVVGATCQVEVKNSSYGRIFNTTMNEIGGGWYNATYNNSKVGKYFCLQNCTSGSLFVAGTCDFVIQGDATMPIATVLVILFVIAMYIILMRFFTLQIFSEHGLVKLLLIMLAFWFLLLPVNVVTRLNEFNGGPASVTSNLDTLFVIMLLVNVFISFYFFLWFIAQIVKKINVSKNKNE